VTPLLVIAGPTASGKTALAVEVARRIGAQIVSADSQQVYRYFDIGTAKPSAAELSAVPHHLVSCVDPLEPFSAARYAALADEAIERIHATGQPVVVVGGTGLYLRVLLHGVIEAPGANPELRSELEALADEKGCEVLHAQLARVDPATAARLPVKDRVRIIRALEISMATGRPASEQREAHGFRAERYRAQWVFLSPPREQVYEAINRRTKAMFAAGLVDEVRDLLARGYRNAAPMGAVGYVQALACVEGQMSEAAAIADVAQKTRHYAKRQWTWFRKAAATGLTLERPDAEAVQRALA
jgi:tRNA dimethylallyltransferase